MTGHERISIDANVCYGQACIRGARIPVHQIAHMLANGDTIAELLEDYPALTREDILAALDYAASPAEEEVTPLESPGRPAREYWWTRIFRGEGSLL